MHICALFFPTQFPWQSSFRRFLPFSYFRIPELFLSDSFLRTAFVLSETAIKSLNFGSSFCELLFIRQFHWFCLLSVFCTHCTPFPVAQRTSCTQQSSMPMGHLFLPSFLWLGFRFLSICLPKIPLHRLRSLEHSTFWWNSKRSQGAVRFPVCSSWVPFCCHFFCDSFLKKTLDIGSRSCSDAQNFLISGFQIKEETLFIFAVSSSSLYSFLSLFWSGEFG